MERVCSTLGISLVHQPELDTVVKSRPFNKFHETRCFQNRDDWQFGIESL